MILFFCDNIQDNEAVLEDEEFRHCIKVLRKTEGDKINITNGAGLTAEAVIEKIDKRTAQLRLLAQQLHAPKTKSLALAIAPPKSKARWEFILEKSVEIGADMILPIRSHNSERIRINTERAAKILRSAALQSLRIHHPQIAEVQDFKEFFKAQKKTDSQVIMAHYKPEYDHLLNIALSNRKLIIMIGPEGDFSKQELQVAEQSGISLARLSNNRLRTETAAIVSLSIINSRLENS
jgi:16S rRNA (uracil1498-N3)-methyltransferase